MFLPPRISTLLKVHFCFVVIGLTCIIELENCASCGLAAGRTSRAIRGLSKCKIKSGSLTFQVGDLGIWLMTQFP